jgi:hypothetical protein
VLVRAGAEDGGAALQLLVPLEDVRKDHGVQVADMRLCALLDEIIIETSSILERSNLSNLNIPALT